MNQNNRLKIYIPKLLKSIYNLYNQNYFQKNKKQIQTLKKDETQDEKQN